VNRLLLDFETYSDVPIQHGTGKYAANAEPLLMAWAVDDGPVDVWRIAEKQPMPDELRRALIDRDVELWAHNAQFDAAVAAFGKHTHAPLRDAGLDLPRWRCTMAQALSHGLPAKLEALAIVLGAPEDRAKMAGRELIHTFCLPVKSAGGIRIHWHQEPVAWSRFVAYAGRDVETMRWCLERLPTWNWRASDIRHWQIDQSINRRGFAVDKGMAEAASWLSDIRKRAVNKKAAEQTDDYVQSVTQRDKVLATLLVDAGVLLPDLKASTIERRLEDPDMPEAARELLLLRLAGSRASLAKYNAILRSEHKGRVRFGFQFRGASRTGRDAGRLFQPQNLPRPKADFDSIEQWIEAAKMDLLAGLDTNDEGVTSLLGFDDLQLAQDALRSVIVAAPGCKLVQCDYSQIELRVAAWVAGEQWKLDALAAFDRGEGPDAYTVTASMMFGIPADQIDTGDQRQSGKVADLACQYGGGTNALGAMADVYRLTLTEEQKSDTVDRWRRANSRIRAYWYALEEAIVTAIHNEGMTVPVGDNGLIKVKRAGAWLLIRLPGGRCLSYPSIKYDPDERQISYMGQNNYTRKWERIRSWGGKFFENICQAIPADILWGAIERLESEGYKIILRVHDELVAETVDEPAYSVDGMREIMIDVPACYAGLPVNADGWEGHRYRK